MKHKITFKNNNFKRTIDNYHKLYWEEFGILGLMLAIEATTQSVCLRRAAAHNQVVRATGKHARAVTADAFP